MQKGFLAIWIIAVIVLAAVGGGVALLVSMRSGSVQVSPIDSVRNTPSALPSVSVDAVVSESPSPSFSATLTLMLTPVPMPATQPSPTPQAMPKVTPTPTPTPSTSSGPTAPPSATPTPTAQPTPTPEATSAPTPTPTPIPTPTPTPTPSPSAESLVLYKKYDHVFSPKDITVLVGTAVTFRNDSLIQNIQVASDPHPAHTDHPEFDSGFLAPGESYTFVFWNVGEYAYHNHLLPGVGGAIHVRTQF